MLRRHVTTRSRGFTIIELMMTIAVLGILVAVAVPLYNDYQTRARVAQVLTTIDTLRTVFHTELATRGEIPKFSPGKPGEIPPELASFPIGPDLLRFDFLDEHLLQSSSHYGPFDGKDIPYLALVARNGTESRHLKAVAHALPHNSYAWIVEPMAMIVPLLDAQTRHQTIANAMQPAVTPQLQPQVVPQVQPQVQPQAQPQVPPQQQAPKPPTCPSGLVVGTDGKCHSISGPAQPPAQTQNTGSQVATAQPARQPATNPRQQYDDCVAHVLAGHPHGHAWGLLKQCDRFPH